MNANEAKEVFKRHGENKVYNDIPAIEKAIESASYAGMNRCVYNISHWPEVKMTGIFNKHLTVLDKDQFALKVSTLKKIFKGRGFIFFTFFIIDKGDIELSW